MRVVWIVEEEFSGVIVDFSGGFDGFDWILLLLLAGVLVEDIYYQIGIAILLSSLLSSTGLELCLS